MNEIQIDQQNIEQSFMNQLADKSRNLAKSEAVITAQQKKLNDLQKRIEELEQEQVEQMDSEASEEKGGENE